MTTPQNFFAHRDASTPCRELLEWLTDVPVSQNGTDNNRRQLRAYPRHTYSYDVVLPKNADKSALTALRTGETFVLPLWCHAFERPALAATAGIVGPADSPQVVALNADSEGLLSTAGAFTWPEGCYIAAPAALGRPVADVRSITYITHVTQAMSVSFRLVDFQEVVGEYTGPTLGGLPQLAPFVDYWTNPAEEVTVDANAFDVGNLDVHEVRYKKRSFTVNLALTSREQIIAFRQLIFSLKGRLNPLSWAAPGEMSSTWRLASDGVEISYLRPGLATCQLSLIELD